MDNVQEESSCFPQDAFIFEFARNSRRIYGYIRTLVPDRSDADDVYQNASLVMWRKFATFSPGTNFFSWGCQIALLEVRKLRERSSRTRLLSPEAIEALSAEFLARHDDAPERLEALSACIEKLAPRSRELIQQRYFHERKPAELASEMQRSLAAVYRALARAHTWLLDCIEQSQAQGK
jgi:RNA polymerase sigma-70 factor, ECF subfamily